ncbi:MAG: hypothetical protein QM817_39085 [Archangium sp.]
MAAVSDAAATPYAEALAMQQAGATVLAIRDRLRALGLDDEGIALLLNAIGARAATPPPMSATPIPATTIAAPVVATATATTCTRCGVFLAGTTTRIVLNAAYCEACAARPEVDYPRAYRDRYWGKRDGWAWFFGLLSLVLMAGGVLMLNQDVRAGLVAFFTGVAWLLFWFGVRIARPAMVAMTTIGAVYNVMQQIPPNIIGILMVTVAMFSTRTKLFFKMEVSEADLAKAWLAQHDNRFAAWSRGTGVVSLLSILAWLGTPAASIFTLGVGLPAIALGVAGLRAVNEKAQPPVGGRTSALVGLACGAFGVVIGAVGLFFAVNLKRLF